MTPDLLYLAGSAVGALLATLPGAVLWWGAR
jgi:hypothetical protein